MIITGNDKRLILQRLLDLRMRLDVMDSNNNVLDKIEGGIISGSSNINAESDVRRTFSFTIIPEVQKDVKIRETGLIWVDKKVKMYIGIKDLVADEFVWYPQSVYVFTNTSATYDEVTNQLQINCSDLMTMLDGTKNGNLGQNLIQVPAYEEDTTTGEVITYNTIRAAMIRTITQLAHIKNYNIDDIGEYKGMRQYNADYLEYREASKVPCKDGHLEEIWNTVPYDLEWSSGTTVMTIVNELRDLYPNYETFFDVDGNFICQMIPSCYDDDITLDDDFIQKILISEDTSIDLSTVRNMSEVWGQSIDTDFYTESCTFSSSTYSVTIDGYTEGYKNGDNVAIKIPRKNPINSKLNINGYGAIPIYDDNLEKPLEAGKMDANTVYVFKIRKRYINRQTTTIAYLLGHWQAHGMNILTDGTVGADYHTTSGTTVKKWSKEYFQDVYNCETVEFSVIPDSPFTIQKIGEVLGVYTGGEFENIDSDALAVTRAEWETWKTARLTDSINITTLICPWLDVNIKVSYRRSDEEEPNQYIIKSINHNIDSGTSTISLMRFYPLYIDRSITPEPI